VRARSGVCSRRRPASIWHRIFWQAISSISSGGATSVVPSVPVSPVASLRRFLNSGGRAAVGQGREGWFPTPSIGNPAGCPPISGLEWRRVPSCPLTFRTRFKEEKNSKEPPEMTSKRVFQAHGGASLRRASESPEQFVLAVQYTTTLNFTSHQQLDNPGPIGNSVNYRGLHVHGTLLIGADSGEVFGLLGARIYARDASKRQNQAAGTRNREPIGQKESYRWLESFESLPWKRPTWRRPAGKARGPSRQEERRPTWRGSRLARLAKTPANHPGMAALHQSWDFWVKLRRNPRTPIRSSKAVTLQVSRPPPSRRSTRTLIPPTTWQQSPCHTRRLPPLCLRSSHENSS